MEYLRAPYVLRKENDVFSVVPYETMLATMLLYAESKRKKPGFFRRTGEGLRLVAQAYYRYSVVGVTERFAIVVDHVQPPEYTLSYQHPVLGELERIASSLGELAGKEYVDRLVVIKNMLRDIVKGKRVEKRELKVLGVVHEPRVLEELSILFSNAPYEGVEGPQLPTRTVNPSAAAEQVEKALREINDASMRLNLVIKQVEDSLHTWRESVEKHYDAERQRLEEELAKIREEVRARIMELRSKREEEKRSVEQRFHSLIESVRKKLQEVRASYEAKMKELEKAAQYGKDTKPLKKEISEIEKRMKELEKELRDLEKKLEEELKAVDAKYDKLEEAERRKEKSVESRIASIEREKTTLLEHGDKLVDEIRRLIYTINSSLMEAKKALERVLIPLPPRGPGDYEVPVLFTVYVSRGEERGIVAPPLYIEVRQGLLRKSQVSEFPGLGEVYYDLASLYGSAGFRNKLEEHNLLEKIVLERIEHGLHDLVRDGLIDHDEAEELIDSIKDQIELIREEKEKKR